MSMLPYSYIFMRWKPVIKVSRSALDSTAYLGGTIYLKDRASGCPFWRVASSLVVMQTTHKLSVTDEVRFVAVLHALSEIELKLKPFR